MNETTDKKPLKRKYKLAAGIIFLLVIFAVFAFILFTQERETKPDPFSERIIRQVAASTLANEANINKEPYDLTDEDFAKIKEIRLGLLRISISLTSPSQELADIKILEKCSNLKILRLENINYPTKTIPKWMKILSKLGIFDLKKRFTIDLRPIEELHSLNLIQIYNVPLKNLKPLAGLTNLQKLFLEEIQLSDIKSLKELKNLTSLSLTDSQVYDLKPLKGLVKLKGLYLSGTKVSDIEPLKGLINLETLILGDTSISDIRPLKNMVNLQTLFIHNTQVSDLEPIKGLVNLKDLYINGTQVINLDPIKNMVSMENLYIYETEISDIEPLTELKNLQKLYIENCPNITDQQVEDLQKALPNLNIVR